MHATLEPRINAHGKGKMLVKDMKIYVTNPTFQAACFPHMDYHVTVYIAYELVGFNLNNLWNSFSIIQKMKYYMRIIYFPHIYPLPIIKTINNNIGVSILENILETYRKKGFTKKIAKFG